MNRFIAFCIIIFVILFSFAVSIPTSPFLLNGMTQKMISDMYFTAITPASFTFSIWGVIYFSWLVLGILMLLKKVFVSSRVSIGFFLAITLSAIWLIPWSFLRIDIAFLIILVMLLLLWFSFFRSQNESKVYRMSLELFMGWIHIAFFANLAVLLHYFGLAHSPQNAILIGQILFACAGFATLYFQAFHKTYIVSLVFLWASVGIYIAQEPSIIIYEVMAFAVSVMAVMIFTFLKRKN